MAAKVTSRVTVLGGGISGLSAAYYLAKNHKDPSKITLVESSPRFGGWLHSVRAESGAIFEQGPRSLRPVGPAGWESLNLASELGLENMIIPVSTSHAGARNRFIYSKGQVHKLPSSIASIVKRQSLFSGSLLPILLREPFVKRRTDESDESVYDFFKRRFSKEVAEYLGDPICRGIFAGDARLLSLRSVFPPVYEMEKSRGSVVKAAILPGKSSSPAPDNHPLVQKSIQEKWSIWSLQGGLQTFADKLHESLVHMGVNVLSETPCRAIEFKNNGSVCLSTDTKDIVSDHLVSTLSTGVLSSVLTDSLQPLKNILNEIKSVSVGLVNLEYKSNLIQDEGFGILLPSSEPVNILGIIYDSCVFPQHDRNDGNHTRLTIMMGGHWFDKHCGNPDTVTPQSLTDNAVKAVNKILRITQEPVYHLSSVQKNCISQYHIGHTDRVQRIFDYVQQNNLPLTLLGASYKGVSVNDCIFNAKKGVEEMLEKL
ncbi:protoporphyrinogen oxidase-like [Actinia tenebrosa]|uniref:Protoporphyrinogen oxidase n=1 Tax=Actinia tenebrosa TaxID=6105 RepID=A0A6P8HJB7_ACTTE|nr:protoporphyrinogen oxidase-like [Actinia tenebrosa]